MPICENCHNKWRWKETIKKTASFDPGMICSYYGKNNINQKIQE